MSSSEQVLSNASHTPSPVVTVAMPVYNAQRYLREAIDSVLAQTFEDWELVAIDDGSTDGSLAILRSYEAADRRVRVISRENRGVGQTRTEMVQAARGEFVATLDSDDVALPQRLERQVAFLREHPEVVCVGSAHEVIDSRSRLLTVLQLPTDDATIQRLALAGHGSICNSASMARRAALLQTGGYDASVAPAEDLDMWLRLGEIGQLANLPDVLVKYRLHAHSLSEKGQTLQRDNARRACEAAWRRRGIQGRFEASDAWRPDESRTSQHQYSLRYGWWAFNSGQRRTAADYALRAVRLAPLASGGWRLLWCSLFRSPPGKPGGSPPRG